MHAYLTLAWEGQASSLVSHFGKHMMPVNGQALGCIGGDNPESTSLHDSTVASFPVDPIFLIELPIAAVRT
jgi:hypothetical protein